MTREDLRIDDPERRAEEAQSAPPTPVQQPEQLAWASAVGNQAVQRLARSVARQTEQEQEPAEEEQAAEASPEGEPELAAEELPEEELPE
jgi:hypothetical protein